MELGVSSNKRFPCLQLWAVAEYGSYMLVHRYKPVSHGLQCLDYCLLIGSSKLSHVILCFSLMELLIKGVKIAGKRK